MSSELALGDMAPEMVGDPRVLDTAMAIVLERERR
jgi:hypothetical protein